MKRFGILLSLIAAAASSAQAPYYSPTPPPYRTIAPQFDSSALVFNAENYISPVMTTNPDYPALQPFVLTNTVTRRFNYNDFLFGATINMNYQHGGSNFMGVDTLLKPKYVSGNFEDVTALTLNLNANTDVQDGGTLALTTNHYGHGDTVMFTSMTNATGGSRGADEHNRVFRVFSQFHGNNYGIQIATLTTDPFGQVIFTPTKSRKGLPTASPGHDLHASLENGPLLDTNPAKIYTAGNVAEVEICPAGTPNAAQYMCVTGDAATRWSERYGRTGITILTDDIADAKPDADGKQADPFAAPLCLDLPVEDSSIFKVGSLFTISSAGDNFEQPAVLSVGAKSIKACLAKPHAKGELVTAGGAIGHALSFTNDDMAPHTVPGLDNQNDSILRLGYPIVASLPGNVMMLWVDSAGSGTELKSRGFTASTPFQPASFSAVLDPATHGIASWTVDHYGDYHAKSLTHEGADYLPPPAISFAGSTCTELPVAHAIYSLINNRELGVKPVTDKPGNCSSIKVTVQREYPNPVSIYPMLWARSNRDPGFVDSRAMQLREMTASTDGYMVAGGGSSEFAVGDPIEFGYWWQQYVTSDIVMSQWMSKSRRYGSYFNIGFNGVYTSALMHLSNFTSPADYYGTPENGYTPGLHGEGRISPPVAYQISGPVSYGLVMQIPRPRACFFADVGGLRFFCGIGPCTHNVWNEYDWINAQGKDGDQAGFRFDPDSHSLTYYDYRNGLFAVPSGIRTGDILAGTPGGVVSIDDAAAHDSRGAIRAGTLQLTGLLNLPCDPSHRFMQNPVPGGPGVADTYLVCLKDAQDQYAWRTVGITK